MVIYVIISIFIVFAAQINVEVVLHQLFSQTNYIIKRVLNLRKN